MNMQTITGKSENRRHFLGGSDARIIMSADEAELIRLWKEKRGEVEPEDLSGNLVVQLGVATEALNRAWYERNTARAISDVQRWVQHPVHRFLAAKLDGFINELDAVFEAKFMLPWSLSEEAAAVKHMAQLQHYMWVTNARSAALSNRGTTSIRHSARSSSGTQRKRLASRARNSTANTSAGARHIDTM